MMPQRKANAVDLQVGVNIRAMRRLRAWSQLDLAAKLGVTFQQVQKYESGSNRVGASRLQQIADALGVPISQLFQPSGADGQGEAQTVPKECDVLAFLATKEGVELNRTFAKINDPKIRKKTVEFLKALVSEDGS